MALKCPKYGTKRLKMMKKCDNTAQTWVETAILEPLWINLGQF